MEMQTSETENKQALDEASMNNEQASQDVKEQPEVKAENAENSENKANAPEVLDPMSALQSENAALKAHLEKVEAAAKSDLQRMVRAIAEADNQRKRAEADVERERKYGIEKFVKALLPVLDSLELAIQHSRQDESSKAMIEGVQNTLTLFLKEMHGFGVEVEDPQGKPFDPQKHQAISMAPSDDVKANNVLNVMQKGYLLHGRVVRAAMVVVSSGPANK